MLPTTARPGLLASTLASTAALAAGGRPTAARRRRVFAGLAASLAAVGLLPAAAAFAGDSGPAWEIRPHDRLALVGGSLAERMRRYGHWEALLHLRFPTHQLKVRNFGWPADEAGVQQRPNDYTHWDDPLAVFAPTVVLMFFGANESFAGTAGLDAFEQNLAQRVAECRRRFASDGVPPRLALVSPAAYESTGERLLPDGVAENERLAAYAEAVRRVAEREGLPFVDLFAATREAFAAESGAQYTINGLHLNALGDRLAAEALDRSLWGSAHPRSAETTRYERLRAAVVDMQWHHQQDYRMINGWYVYGGRSQPFGVVNFPEEFRKLRKMVADRDATIWALAEGVDPPALDDRTPPLADIPSTFGTQSYSEPKDLRFLSPAEAEGAMTIPERYRIQTFASEVEFPELANPVQMAFDNRGRLWAACMPTYPQWRPGDPLPSDRLVIFTDEDGDGRADAAKTFARDLHCPVGFEFWNGGVLVIDQPQLVWLKDTDGDDEADERVVVLDGLASDDTHHACGAFDWTPDGRLIMLEGIAMSTAVETPWGPFRHRDVSAAYAFDPRLWRIDVHIEPCFANPWCYTHNDWGQGFVGDGTGAQQHWATPLSGARFDGRQGTRQWIQYDGPVMRPALGNGFLVSRHFPDDAQGNFYFACVINMNGILQFSVREQGSGYQGSRLENLVVSSDANFRPGDPQIGPDGALYFVDWHNPLIGHMQYSQRDPHRDHRHGRIYRLSAKGRPPLTPVTQYGKSIPELLEQLRAYETSTRDRARRELRDRPTAEVVAAVEAWLTALDAADPLHDRLLAEALWVLEGHHAVDVRLLEKVLSAGTPDARAAAVHAVANQREWLVDEAGAEGCLKWIAPLVHDPHPRVRLEAVRALSFFSQPESVGLALEALAYENDEELAYTIDSTLAALRPLWVDRLADWTADRPAAATALQRVASRYAKSQAATALLRELAALPRESERQTLVADRLLGLEGQAEQGQAVFKRQCVACHRIGAEGAEFGPNLSDAGKRLPEREIVASIVDPNAKIDPKYRATNFITAAGKALSGLVIDQNDQEVAVVLGDGKVAKIAVADIVERQEVEVSSMPERLYESMSGAEFVDLIAYLKAQQTPPAAASTPD